MDKQVIRLTESQLNEMIENEVYSMIEEGRLDEWKWLNNLANAWGDMKRSYNQARWGQDANPYKYGSSQPDTTNTGASNPTTTAQPPQPTGGAVNLQSLQQTLLQALNNKLLKGQSAKLAQNLYQMVSNQVAGIKNQGTRQPRKPAAKQANPKQPTTQQETQPQQDTTGGTNPTAPVQQQGKPKPTTQEYLDAANTQHADQNLESKTPRPVMAENRKPIRLTEADLNKMIEETVYSMLAENQEDEDFFPQLAQGVKSFFGAGYNAGGHYRNTPNDRAEQNGEWSANWMNGTTPIQLGRRWDAAKTGWREQGKIDKNNKELKKLAKRQDDEVLDNGMTVKQRVTDLKRRNGGSRGRISGANNDIYRDMPTGVMGTGKFNSAYNNRNTSSMFRK